MHRNKSGLFLNWPSALFLGLLFVMGACAQVASPTGGPKDETPPRIVSSTPAQYAVRFQGGQIRILFDEYIELRNLRQQLLISPPLSEIPDIRIRGKSLIIQLGSELREETTYNFFLGDAIRDITEGNVIPNFQFVFSTGDYVDSLSVRGQVVNAHDLKPEKDVFVMLYENTFDSVPYLERPVYLAKTDKEGGFEIRNIREGKYLMFALEDKNANFLFDMPDERIAFLDSLVVPVYITDSMAVADSLAVDENGRQLTTGAEIPELPDLPDTPDEPEGEGPGEDRLADAKTVKDTSGFFRLYLFKEEDTLQRITSARLIQEGKILLTFRIPYEELQLTPVLDPNDHSWFLAETGLKKDSLTIWVLDQQRDSLIMEVRDGSRFTDTLRISLRRTDSPSRTPGFLPAFAARQGGTWPHFQNFSLVSPVPLSNVEHSLIQLFLNDTIPIDADFGFTDDIRRQIRMDTPPEPDKKYLLKVLPGALTDVFGNMNDSLVRSFKTSSTEDFGKLLLDLDLPDGSGNYILQLLDRGGLVLREQFVKVSGMQVFDFLIPGNYGIRLIEDRNQNRRWDTGQYLRGLQPEKVYMYPGNIQIRQNWDSEIPWKP